MYVIGVNPVFHWTTSRKNFPDRERLVPASFIEENGPWIEAGNTVIVAPTGALLAGPVRETEETLVAQLDLTQVAAARRFMDPTGHDNRPDVFQLLVDTTSRQATTVIGGDARPTRRRRLTLCQPGRWSNRLRLRRIEVTRTRGASRLVGGTFEHHVPRSAPVRADLRFGIL